MYTFICICGAALTSESTEGRCACGREFKLEWQAKDVQKPKPYIPSITDEEGLK